MKVLNSCNVHAADSGQASTISAASSSEEGARHIFNPTRAFALGALHMRGTWGRASSFSFFKGNFEPEVLDRLFKALARLGADSRAAAQAQAIGFESRAVPLSFRVLSRMRNMMLDAARMPAASDDDPLRRIIRTSLTEALDSTAREAAETLAVTAIGNLIHEMRVSRARMVLKNATGSARKAASV